MAQVVRQKCYLCNENNGTLYCYECKQALCGICRGRHDKIPAIKEHTITDIHSANHSTFNRKTLCLTHEKEFLCYCEKCDVLICGKCVTSTHKDHSFTDINEVVRKERFKANESMTELARLLEYIIIEKEKIKRNHLENFHAETQKAIGEIQSAFRQLSKFVESTRRINTTKLENNEKVENEKFKTYLFKTDSIYRKCTQLHDRMEKLLMEKHELTFYLTYNAIKDEIKKLDILPKQPLYAQVQHIDRRLIFRDIEHYIDERKSSCSECVSKIRIIDQLRNTNEELLENLQSSCSENVGKNMDIAQIRKTNEELRENLQSFSEIIKLKEEDNKRLKERLRVIEKEKKKLVDEIRSLKQARKADQTRFRPVFMCYVCNWSFKSELAKKYHDRDYHNIKISKERSTPLLYYD